jgi:hypothetical protein
MTGNEVELKVFVGENEARRSLRIADVRRFQCSSAGPLRERQLLMGSNQRYRSGSDIRCSDKTTLYRLVQQLAASFIAHTEASTGSELPRFIKDEFDAFLERNKHLAQHIARRQRSTNPHDSRRR